MKLDELSLPRSSVRNSSIQQQDPRGCLRPAANHSSSEALGSHKPGSQSDKRVTRALSMAWARRAILVSMAQESAQIWPDNHLWSSPQSGLLLKNSSGPIAALS